jgi:hypothetical protein
MLTEYQTSTAFVVRIAFVLANLTTYFDEAREQVCLPDNVKQLFTISLVYFEREENAFNQKKEESKGRSKREEAKDVGANIEDTLVKLIRLVANVCTDE